MFLSKLQLLAGLRCRSLGTIALLTASLTACSIPSRKVAFDDKTAPVGEAVVIIGVSPARAKITLAEGGVSGDIFGPKKGGILAVESSEDGILVLRLPGNRHYAITSVAYDATPVSDPSSAQRPQPDHRTFPRCGLEQTESFHAPADATIYVGHLDFSVNPDPVYGRFLPLQTARRWDPEAARSHMAKHYSGLNSNVRSSPFTTVKVAIPCYKPPPPSIPIYIFIPRR